MKLAHLALIAAAGMTLAGQAGAADESALAKSKNCFSCHTLDKKLVGPNYKEVAAKYKGDAGAAAKLATKIKAGGSGAWGAIPMPPNNVSEAEAKKLADWILSLK